MNIKDIVDYLPEIYFFNDVVSKNMKHDIIFDVGCSRESIYLEENYEVHYFEPYLESLDILSKKNCFNKKSIFNNFGLGDIDGEYSYYDVGSVFNRSQGVSELVCNELFKTNIIRGDRYLFENNISNIDLLKIDVEGFELNVLKGFGEQIKNINYIQFEYGDGLADCGFKMIDIINYLTQNNFENFAYLVRPVGYRIIDSYEDHWQWCNIVCSNKYIK